MKPFGMAVCILALMAVLAPPFIKVLMSVMDFYFVYVNWWFQ